MPRHVRFRGANLSANVREYALFFESHRLLLVRKEVWGLEASTPQLCQGELYFL
jgi:hypothetical protein